MGSCKTVLVAGQEVKVSELTMRDIHDLAVADMTSESVVTGVRMLVEKATTLSAEQLMGQYPSDLQPLIEALLEVNKAFFGQAAALGMQSAAALVENKIKGLFMLACVPLSEPGTPTPGTTRSPSS